MNNLFISYLKCSFKVKNFHTQVLSELYRHGQPSNKEAGHDTDIVKHIAKNVRARLNFTI